MSAQNWALASCPTLTNIFCILSGDYYKSALYTKRSSMVAMTIQGEYVEGKNLYVLSRELVDELNMDFSFDGLEFVLFDCGVWMCSFMDGFARRKSVNLWRIGVCGL